MVLLFVLFVTIPAQSALSAEQGVLHIEAVVPSLVEIVVSQEKDADLFDLTVKQEMLKVGVVKEWANIRNLIMNLEILQRIQMILMVEKRRCLKLKDWNYSILLQKTSK